MRRGSSGMLVTNRSAASKQAMKQNTHEAFAREEVVVAGSDRSFGLVMTAAFAILSLLNGWHDGRIWPWTAGIAVVFFVASLIYPTILNPLNRLWLKFGLLLHKVVNPIVMALLFYGVVLPTGLIMRAPGRDLLRIKRDPQASSYWIVRQPPGPAPETMKDQF